MEIPFSLCFTLCVLSSGLWDPGTGTGGVCTHVTGLTSRPSSSLTRLEVGLRFRRSSIGGEDGVGMSWALQPPSPPLYASDCVAFQFTTGPKNRRHPTSTHPAPSSTAQSTLLGNLGAVGVRLLGDSVV